MGTATRPSGATELNVINRCLRAIGDTPIQSLPTDDNDVSDAGLIRQEIEDVTREVCEAGYYFNYEASYKFSPDGDSHIVLPVTLASWNQSMLPSYKLSGGAGSNLLPLELTERYYDGDRMLYDKLEQTNEFDNDVYLDVCWYMPMDEIPNPYRKYIGAEAALRFLVPNDGDLNTISLMQKELADADVLMMKEEVKSSGPCIEHSAMAAGGSSISRLGNSSVAARFGA